jgi:hypothetical protein
VGGGVLLNLALIGLAARVYPQVFAAERLTWVIADVALLVAYGIFAWLVASRSTVQPAALWRAVWLGAAAGALQAADIAREYLTSAAPFSLLGVLLVSAGLFAAAGRRQGEFASGALVGAWCAISSMLLLWVLAWLLNYWLMGRLEEVLVRDYDYTHGNTLHDPAAYTVWNTLSAAFSHAVLLPCLGALFGGVAGALAGVRAPKSRP